jgi:hypothetical protein
MYILSLWVSSTEEKVLCCRWDGRQERLGFM